MSHVSLKYVCGMFHFISTLYCLHTGNPLTGTLANREGPDEMQHNAEFHRSLHILLRLKNLQG